MVATRITGTGVCLSVVRAVASKTSATSKKRMHDHARCSASGFFLYQKKTTSWTASAPTRMPAPRSGQGPRFNSPAAARNARYPRAASQRRKLFVG